jgi:hypothetical protein
MPNEEQVPTPTFARLYAAIVELAEAKGASEHRDGLLAGLSTPPNPTHRPARRDWSVRWCPR